MSTRRNPRRSANTGMSLAELDPNPASSSSSSASEEESSSDDDDTSVDDNVVKRQKTSKRTSSRTTRFQSSMQEPRDSIRDLLVGGNEFESPRKSSAKSHSSARRKVKTAVAVDDSDEDESSLEDDEVSEDDEEDEPLKIQRIIASRSEPRRVWKDICSKMHTSEVDYGSRWNQEKNGDDDTFEERFLVKWSDASYLHCSWETRQDLVEQVDGAKTYLSTFFKKSDNGLLFTADERCDGDYFDPAFVQIDRILEVDPPEGMKELPKKRCNDEDIVETFGIILDREDENFESGTGRQFLVKWKNTPYSDATFEFERDLILNEVDYLDDLKALEKRSVKPTKTDMRKAEKIGDSEELRLAQLFRDEDEEKKHANIKAYQDELAEQIFPNGGQLRDYQAEGVTWLLSNFIGDRSSILSDEMGLGKTLQTATFIDLVDKKLHRRGPFLIVAPLSTIPHWQREFTNWTDLNTIVYHGSATDRELLREFEFAFPCDRPKNGVGLNQSFLRKCMPKSRKPAERTWMAQVVITTPEMLVTDDFAELASVDWEVLVVDEAHRLKNHSSRLATNLRDRRFDFGYTLLLTGTPIQNNMTELWTLLNFIDPDQFEDLDAFLEDYGDMKSKERVDELHERIRPYILRRLKEDVEKSVPPKEETLIEVELTVLQKQYYRALYEKNVQFLHKNKSKALDGPSLNNLAMQLRKCCNHPFLLNGVEEDIREKEENSPEKLSEGDFLVKASGKLVLLDKLLPRLKAGGHRVLIFSQFKIMLDILQDYLTARQMKFERIDGSITGNKRQMAIDRFQAPSADEKEPPLVMLLSTRAGGVGINLTAADTCIIYDSDWNPQNDLQASARCHRIGQTKSVKVYRLLSRKTYEMQMFHMSSLKMGLDQAVLQGFESSSSSGDGAMTKEEVERLLRHGAYDIFNEEKAGSADAESNDFIQQDIDSILERRSKTVTHDQTGSNAAGGTFSKASFKAPKTPVSGQGKAQADDVDLDDPEFWTKMVGEAKVDNQDTIATGKKRKRKQAHYSEKAYDKVLEGNLLLSGTDASDGSDSESDDEDEWSVQEAEDESLDSQIVDSLEAKPAAKLVKRKKERTKWGGSKANQWDKQDAQKLVKALLLYGYANMPWDEFIRKSSIDAERLDAEEVKRMSWAILLFSLRESAKEDAQRIQTKERRKAEKQRAAREVEASDAAAKENGGVLGSNLNDLPAAGQNDVGEDQLNISFKRLVDANDSWLPQVIRDATDFANSHPQRSKNAVDRALRSHSPDSSAGPKDLNTLFAANLWQSLKSRGWKTATVVDGEFSGAQYWEYNGKEYRSPHAVLVAVPEIHNELAKTVENILVLTGSTPDWKENEVIEAKSLGPSNISPSLVSTFLEMFAPSQLLVDRRKHKLLTIQRRVLNSCAHLSTAHSFFRQASNVPGPSSVIDKLASGLNLKKQTAKPHPSWTSRHDAVLIGAIVKHGWIEQDSSCRAISEDSTIKWGAPFDAGDGEEVKRPASVPKAQPSLEVLRETAQEVARFFNAEKDLIEEAKGFSQSEVAKTYGLIQSCDEADSSLSQNIPTWAVDNTVLLESLNRQSSKNGSDDASAIGVDEDLPTKKDLLKRAKTLLSKGSLLPRQPVASVASSEGANPASDHDFSALDQSNPSNIFLAELLRGLLKVSFSKSAPTKAKKMAKYLCAIAQSEARRLCESVRRHGTDAESQELEKIAGHIRLVARTMTASYGPAKNVVRVVLGEAPVPAKNSSEPLFPFVGTMELQMSTTTGGGGSSSAPAAKKAPAPRKKSKPSRREEAPAGNKALSAALAKGHEKNKDADGKFSVNPDPTTLELTASEMMILTILCNQGLPVWHEDHANVLKSEVGEGEHMQLDVQRLDDVILWRGVAGVVLCCAEAWVHEAKAKLERFQAMTATDANRVKRTTDLREAKREYDEKFKALAHAKCDVENPLTFAKKCLLLLEAVRLRMGPVDTKRGDTRKKRILVNRMDNYLGPNCLDWLRKDTARWATSLNLVDAYGRPMSGTFSTSARDGDKGFTLFAVMSKKHCRSVYAQIAQHTRARSIFMTHSKDEVLSFVERATKQSRSMEDVWDEKPEWWNSSLPGQGSIHDHDLLQGLVSYGFTDYKSIFSSTDSFARGKENYELVSNEEVDNKQEFFLSQKAVQTRVNQLTREMDAHIRSLEAYRIVGKKKDRLSSGSDSLLMATAEDGKEKKGHEVQTGLEAFFSVKPAALDKKPAAVAKNSSDTTQVLDLCDDSDVEVVAPPKQDEACSSDVEVVSPRNQSASAKRKERPTSAAECSEARESPEKKPKVA